MRKNFWVWLYLTFGVDTACQRKAWMKICAENQRRLEHRLFELDVAKNELLGIYPF
jgi:hypothetical protein